MSFKKGLPDFFEEVQSLLLLMNRQDLVSQLPRLEITYRCPCTNPGCASFTVAGSSTPDAFELAGEKRSTFAPSLKLNAERGSVTLIIDQLGRITGFEVLRRPDVRRKLMRL